MILWLMTRSTVVSFALCAANDSQHDYLYDSTGLWDTTDSGGSTARGLNDNTGY